MDNLLYASDNVVFKTMGQIQLLMSSKVCLEEKILKKEYNI